MSSEPKQQQIGLSPEVEVRGDVYQNHIRPGAIAVLYMLLPKVVIKRHNPIPQFARQRG